jgi:hypothetical protein
VPQQFYAGWVRTREVAHDASVYRMVMAERDRIEANGGHLTRVVLDHELKGRVYRELNRPQEPSTPEGTSGVTCGSDEHRDAVAAANDLTVADGHMQFPDARLEYETATGERAHVDLELVTEHYHAAHLAGKRAAGFTLYRIGGSASGHAGGTPHDPRHRGGRSR